VKENSKLIKLKEEVNEKTEELSGEDELDTTDINNLIYAAATSITQIRPAKEAKIEEMKIFGK
jgi:hypothetical protein